jgi:branched-chain amino acid transport system ATP-binding protein
MLEVRDLTSGYGAVRVLAGVRLDCRVGQCVSVVGANGAGKSTLLKTIAGILKPTSGTITWKGARIGGLPPQKVAAAGLSLVPEGRGMLEPLTVLENLEVGGHLARKRSKAEYAGNLQKVFDLFPVLSDRKAQVSRSLSGGEQQMLAIGRALMRSPEMLMLDEPSLGLAPAVADRIYDAIRELRDRGMGVVLVEPSPERVVAIASRVMVLAQGRVVRDMSIEEFQQSHDEFFSMYFGDIPSEVSTVTP